MYLRIRSKKIGNWFESDQGFDSVYPPAVRALSRRHWTPVAVAKLAGRFLYTRRRVKVLDIGSGAGKFCLTAGHFYPEALFTGIEQRWSLIEHAERAREIIKQDNVVFLHGNFSKLDFGDYDHFYFYNSFYENIDHLDPIDETIERSFTLYNHYIRCMAAQLEQKPAGTRLVTYHSTEEEIPLSYRLVWSEKNSLLKYWQKV